MDVFVHVLEAFRFNSSWIVVVVVACFLPAVTLNING